jgi:dTDP-4-amino-4,6-dideoxygalactose transaminase
VICPSYTFIATANAVLYVGATPVFAEIEPDTWNIDPEDVARRITPRTRAIIAVHQVGLAADLDRLRMVARDIRIIEDAACAIGSTYRGRPIGSHGSVACFSFHPRKIISTGEGGMLTTDYGDIAERVRRLRSHAASVPALARHEAKGIVVEEYRELGFNYRMSDVQAALGIEQLKKLERLLTRRRAIAARYDEAFTVPAMHDLVRVPATPRYAGHAYQSYGIRLMPACGCTRDDLLRKLIHLGIACRRGIAPVHREPLYVNRYGPRPLPVTEQVAEHSLFLPMFASLSDADQSRVIDAVTSIITRRPSCQ